MAHRGSLSDAGMLHLAGLSWTCMAFWHSPKGVKALCFTVWGFTGSLWLGEAPQVAMALQWTGLFFTITEQLASFPIGPWANGRYCFTTARELLKEFKNTHIEPNFSGDLSLATGDREMNYTQIIF